MKSLHILTASAVALASFALAGTAMSQTVVRISGATTYRAPITQAIIDSLDSGYTFAYDSSTTSATAVYGAGAGLFKGTLNVSGHPSVIIKTYFTGSLAGVVDLAQQNNITKWIPNSVNTSAAPGTNVNGTGYTAESAPCQATLSDAFASSVANSVATASAPQGRTVSKLIRSLTFLDAGATASNSNTVGIVPFAWVMGKVSTAGGVPTYTYTTLKADGTANNAVTSTVPFGNINQQQAAALISGPTPLSFFTGASADQNKFVLLTGRNEDSGTRIGAFAEGQTGFGNAPTQFQLSFNPNVTSNGSTQTGGANSTIAGGALWPGNSPLNTNNSINWNTPGHSGYNTGGDVGNVLKSTNPVVLASFPNGLTGTPPNLTHAYFAGYLGIADATGVTGGTIMNYNGVAYSVANVQNGLYTFWAFEHLYYLSGSVTGAITGTPKTIVDTIADKIFSVDADVNSGGLHAQPNAAGIFYDSNFLPSRNAEGGVLFGNYY